MLIEVHPDNADDRKIEQIVHILENDGLIVIPTDTIYAFAVSLNSKKGLEKLAKIKVKFLSTQKNTLEKKAEIIDVIDIWTFEKILGSKDPTWILAEVSSE